MALANRVDPFGAIHAVAARGTLMGNRGVLHGEGRALSRRRWTRKAWIICRLAFAGRRRVPMTPGRYTELSFLDEVTALAAGHRPCFECRREAARAFVEAAEAGLAETGLRAADLDERLHRQRPACGHPLPSVGPATIAALPDGTMVAVDGRPYALFGESALPWSFHGYGAALTRHALAGAHVRRITPALTVAALAAGYRPERHAAGPA